MLSAITLEKPDIFLPLLPLLVDMASSHPDIFPSVYSIILNITGKYKKYIFFFV